MRKFTHVEHQCFKPRWPKHEKSIIQWIWYVLVLFHRGATCFALVALKVRDLELAQVMIDALVALHGGALEPTTVKYLTEEGDLAEFAKVGLLSNQKGIKK